MILNEHDFRGPAAQGFDANCAGSREEIRETRAGNVRGQHVEQSFTQAIARGTKREAFQAFQDAAAVRSGDDAH